MSLWGRDALWFPCHCKEVTGSTATSHCQSVTALSPRVVLPVLGLEHACQNRNKYRTLIYVFWERCGHANRWSTFHLLSKHIFFLGNRICRCSIVTVAIVVFVVTGLCDGCLTGGRLHFDKTKI